MTPERLALAEAAIATARAVTAHMTMDADARRILGIPDGVDTAEHLQRVAHALADALSPLAPWPPGWVVVPEEGVVAFNQHEDGGADAWVDSNPGGARWCINHPRRWGLSANVLDAIADCMAALAAAHPDRQRAAAHPDGGGA